MKIYLSVDIEGVSGVVHGDMMMPSEPEYGRGRRLMTRDTNAAIEGLVNAGAELVLVNDSHGPMRNILIEELHEAAYLVSGSGDAKPFCQLQGADSAEFDAAIFVGYHAMAKTPNAIHPHTIAGAAVAELRINGVPHGETGLNAAVLASLEIPTVMVTGDETTVAEAHRFLGPAIETVAVKDACGRNAAICRPLAACYQDIAAAAERAVGQIDVNNRYMPDEPWALEVDFNSLSQADRAFRTESVEQTGPLTARIHGDGPWSQYRSLWAALRSAMYEPAGWLG